MISVIGGATTRYVFETNILYIPHKPSKTFLESKKRPSISLFLSLSLSISVFSYLLLNFSSSMDRPHWPQEMVVKPMEETLVPNTTNSSNNNNNNINNNFSKPSSSCSSFERRARPQKAASVNCPRCNSTNTKFCYYNNYSLSQPRYFCKSCRRYWTEGGTLRNIPVGGGSRKNKRSTPSSCSTSSSYSKTLPDLVVSCTSPLVLSQNPRIIHHDQHGQDLNLGFSSTNNFKNVSQVVQAPNFDATRVSNSSALELLNGITTRGVQNSFMPVPNPNSVYTPQLVIPVPEFKIPAHGFTLDGMGSGDHGGRLLFPFQELRSNTSTPHHDGQNKDQNYDSNGFWNGMMGGGSWNH
ncbi:hypothetical protein QVD17_28333 [Tagetes erecta]|uniref:Dof zinc finger protein n=1 Tax=Tagetes erecta TaxID=13708 RepID=A0AAD8KAS8_TARER|nr:hypothetical protein QVD17_28333 [Tagetes erecta]